MITDLLSQKYCWMKTIQQDLISNNLSLNETIDVAQNCQLWRLWCRYVWHYALASELDLIALKFLNWNWSLTVNWILVSCMPFSVSTSFHHLRSHHLSLPLPFTPDLKLISFTNPFLHSHSNSFRTDFTDPNLYWIKGALALFVLVSGYVC